MPFTRSFSIWRMLIQAERFSTTPLEHSAALKMYLTCVNAKIPIITRTFSCGEIRVENVYRTLRRSRARLEQPGQGTGLLESKCSRSGAIIAQDPCDLREEPGKRQWSYPHSRMWRTRRCLPSPMDEWAPIRRSPRTQSRCSECCSVIESLPVRAVSAIPMERNGSESIPLGEHSSERN